MEMGRVNSLRHSGYVTKSLKRLRSKVITKEFSFSQMKMNPETQMPDKWLNRELMISLSLV
jgi:hypothetical protein